MLEIMKITDRDGFRNAPPELQTKYAEELRLHLAELEHLQSFDVEHLRISRWSKFATAISAAGMSGLVASFAGTIVLWFDGLSSSVGSSIWNGDFWKGEGVSTSLSLIALGLGIIVPVLSLLYTLIAVRSARIELQLGKVRLSLMHQTDLSATELRAASAAISEIEGGGIGGRNDRVIGINDV